MKLIFSVYTVYIHRINSALKSFVESWNNHSLSSAHSLTPNQLFIQGAMQQNTIPVIPSTSNSPAALPQPVARDHVLVPDSNFHPCEGLEDDVRRIDVMQSCNDFGYHIYKQVLQVVGNLSLIHI